MSRVLRSLGRLTRQAMAEGSEVASNGSVRHSHTEISGRYSPNPFSKEAPLDRSAGWYPKNPYIDSWVYMRDRFAKEYSWNARSAFEVGYLVIGLSAAIYGFSVWTIRQADAKNHYPERDMILAGSSSKFRLPDEREWY